MEIIPAVVFVLVIAVLFAVWCYRRRRYGLCMLWLMFGSVVISISCLAGVLMWAEGVWQVVGKG